MFNQTLKRIEWWFKQFPVTAGILSICVIVWLFERFLGESIGYRIYMAGLFEPHFAINYLEIWRFFTSLFMHDPSGIFHIGFNMWALVMCGPIFERYFKWKKYLIIYLGSGLFGNIFLSLWTFLFEPHTQSYALGASGCIFGLFAGLAILYKRIGIDPSQIIIVVAINLVFGFISPGISWQSHVGGLIAGVCLTKFFLNNNRQYTLN